DRLRTRPGRAGRAGREPGRLGPARPAGQPSARSADQHVSRSAGQPATRTVTLKVWVIPHLRGFDEVGPVGVTCGPHGLRVEVMAATPGWAATKAPPVTPSASARCPFAVGAMAAELDLRASHLRCGVPLR